MENTRRRPHNNRKRINRLQQREDHRKARQRQSAEKRKTRMRFLVDGMLGGLARWLRILGEDVRYDASTEDTELLRIAYEENMVLLTRDEELCQRTIAKRIPSALVLGETMEERLAQI